MTPEHFSRFIGKNGTKGKENWDNVKQSAEDLAFNSRIERGTHKTIDKGTHINDQQGDLL